MYAKRKKSRKKVHIKTALYKFLFITQSLKTE